MDFFLWKLHYIVKFELFLCEKYIKVVKQKKNAIIMFVLHHNGIDYTFY